jgi:hypothetical protein
MIENTATYNGTTEVRNSKTVTYTHAAWVRKADGTLFVYRWSKTAEAAAKPLPHGWEAHRVATTEVVDAAAAVEVAEVEVVETVTEVAEVAEVAETVTETVATEVEAPIVAALNGRAPVYLVSHQGRQMWAAEGVLGRFTSKARATAAWKRAHVR